MVMSQKLGEGAGGVDVEGAGFEPSPPASAPRPSSRAIASSGVRGTADEGESDYEDDAPQFFDRKVIERLASPPAAPAAPQRTPVASASQLAAPSSGLIPPPVASGSSIPHLAVDAPALLPSSPRRRIPPAWAAVAAVVFAVAIVVALALR
jgi:hypothetical protein